jgi:hypothetical protein
MHDPSCFVLQRGHPGTPQRTGTGSHGFHVAPSGDAIDLLPNMRLVTFAQGLLGAPSPKPTTLLVFGLHGLEADMRAGRVTTDLPHGSSVGKDATGQYRTAPLKKYPPAMCRAR